MSNKVSLERRRRSFRAGAGSKTFGPVGVQLSEDQRSDHLGHCSPGGDGEWVEVDTGCPGCGYHVCSCQDEEQPAPTAEAPSNRWNVDGGDIIADINRALEREEPKPAAEASAEPAVPKGWRWPPGSSFCEPERPVGNRMLVTASNAGWRGHRGYLEGDEAEFTNFHAACLHALGCVVHEVTEAPRGARVAEPGKPVVGYYDRELPALVEHLTAERARGR